MVFEAGGEPGQLIGVEIVEATPHSLIGVPESRGAAAARGAAPTRSAGRSGENPRSAVKWKPRPADEGSWRGDGRDPAADPLRVIG